MARRRVPRYPPMAGQGSATGVGALTVPAGRVARRARPAVRRRGRTPFAQVPQLRLEVGLEPGAVLALERAQLVDLLLEHRLVAGDAADDLRLLPLGVADQLGGLVTGLALEGLGAGARVGQHRVGLGLGLGGEPFGHLLRHAEHLRHLDVVVAGGLTGPGHLRRWRGHRTLRLHGPLHGRRLDGPDLLRGRRNRPHRGCWWTRAGVLQVGLDVAEALFELGDLLAEIVVLLDQPGQLGLDQIEERVDLVLVVPPLPNGGFAERDVVDVSGRQRHRITSCSPRRRHRATGARYGVGWATFISMNTTSSRTIIDRSRPTPPIRTTGITLRNNFTGGSVAVKISSNATALGPAGTHCRAKLRTSSATMRPIRSSQKKNSTL